LFFFFFQYEKTAAAVCAEEDWLGTLVELLCVYREKGGAIFTRTCMLLALLASDPQRNQVKKGKEKKKKLQIKF
jgi:hypothetical protein